MNDIMEIIQSAFIERARKVFEDSQENCPVVSGTLKRSGTFYDTPENVGLIYNAPYAEIVEEGARGGIKTVRPYITSKGVSVSRHTMFYHGREGRHFVGNAIDSGEQQIQNDVDAAIRQNFKVL